MQEKSSFLSAISSSFHKRPLTYILILAFVVRLIAVFFARGYMMHDDHFLTIEPSGSWAVGKNFNQWLPGIGNDNLHPEPISFFYLGGLFLLFKLFIFLGIDTPETQMYLIRLVHALYSLLIVYYGYKITELLSSKRQAILAGLLLALLAILPNFSVRNLVEIVCIPPILIGFYVLLKNVHFKTIQIGSQNIQAGSVLQTSTSNNPLKYVLFAAILMGLAVGIRYQTGLLVALVGLVLLIHHSFKYAFLFGIVSFSAFFITQIDDILLWGGEPFQHLKGYFEYNKKNASNYPGSPLAYLSFITGFILPPISLFLAAGFLRSWKKQLLVVLPVLGFVLFHLLYPNRQERFILPALPFVVIIGVIGWYELIQTSTFWKKRPKILHASWIFFWTLNTVGMLTLCFTYSKKSRVEAMCYLHDQGDCRNFALEFTHSDGGAMMPQFYSGTWTSYFYWHKGDDPIAHILNMQHDEEVSRSNMMPRLEPNYYLFYDDELLEERVNRIRKHYPSLSYQKTIESGWFDELLHFLNPKNSLEKIHIYKIPDLVPVSEIEPYE